MSNYDKIIARVALSSYSGLVEFQAGIPKEALLAFHLILMANPELGRDQ